MVMIATAIPTAAISFPVRAVTGERRRIMPKMKNTEVTRYAICCAWSLISGRLPNACLGSGGSAEHLENPIRHDESADHIDGSKSHFGRSDRHTDPTVCAGS